MTAGRDRALIRIVFVLVTAALLGAGGAFNPAEATPGARSLSNATDLMRWGDMGNTAFRTVGGPALKFVQGYKALSPTDEEVTPDFDPPGRPDVPVHCADPGDPCWSECYADLVPDLDRHVQVLEDARRLYTSTMEVLNWGIHIGRSGSAINPLTGLAWAQQEQEIRASIDYLEQSYDDKVEETLAGIDEILQGIGACEQELFGEDGWYSRFGGFYNAFIELRYVR